MERTSPAWRPEPQVVEIPSVACWALRRAASPSSVRPRSRSLRVLLVALGAGILVGLAASLLGGPVQRLSPEPAPRSLPLLPVLAQDRQTHALQCEGKRFCSQMHSCAEASFYVSHCPDTQLEQDERGVPCAAQLCWL
jgi:hypothetical protein